jgi:ParB family transcriptional regulator, chromosome partitioning protein
VSNQRRLGRGLEALLGRTGPGGEADGTAAAEPPPASGPSPAAAARLFLHSPEAAEQAVASLPADTVPVTSIDPNPWQPRSVLDDGALAELAESIREHGLVQPIVVRQQGDRYQLIAGQRRLAAARRVGWTRILARVLEVDDRQMAEIAIVENLQRRDLDALEKAASFKQYLANWQCTQEELAKRLSVDRSTVANLIRLLDLPGDVQQLLRAGSISMGHARALLPIGDEPVQVRLARRVVDEGLSVRAVEEEVKEILRNDEDDDAFGEGAPGARRGGRPVAKRPAQIIAMENDLRRALGTKVVVQATSKGSGKIVIPFADADEFQRLLEFLTAEVV